MKKLFNVLICFILLILTATSFAAETTEVVNGEVVKIETIQTVKKIDAVERLKNIKYEITQLQAELVRLQEEKALILNAGIVEQK